MGSLNAVSGSVGLYHGLLEFSRRGHAGVWLRPIRLELFLHVGIIASAQRILAAGVEFSHQDDIPEEIFRHYLIDMGLHVMVILVLMVSLFLLKNTEQPVEPLLTK